MKSIILRFNCSFNLSVELYEIILKRACTHVRQENSLVDLVSCMIAYGGEFVQE